MWKNEARIRVQGGEVCKWYRKLTSVTTTNVENGRWVTASSFWAKPKHYGNERQHHSQQVISSSSSRLRIMLSPTLMLRTRTETCQVLWCWSQEARFQFSAEFSWFNDVWLGCLLAMRWQETTGKVILVQVFVFISVGWFTVTPVTVSLSDFSRYLTFTELCHNYSYFPFMLVIGQHISTCHEVNFRDTEILENQIKQAVLPLIWKPIDCFLIKAYFQGQN